MLKKIKWGFLKRWIKRPLTFNQFSYWFDKGYLIEVPKPVYETTINNTGFSKKELDKLSFD